VTRLQYREVAARMTREPPTEERLLALRLHDGQTDDPGRIEAARLGDPLARDWIVKRWTDPVYRFAIRMMTNEEDARDIAQETMVKVLRNLDQFDPTRSFATWVFGIARNTCIDEHRRRKRRSWDEPGEITDTRPSPLQEVTRAERADRVIASLEQLPPMYREVIVLYHFEHLKYVEIAEVLDIPLGTVMNRIFRARRKLRELYEEHGGENDVGGES
jgi:RNA polymerase sigma-70 factor (ECF subfamily)